MKHLDIEVHPPDGDVDLEVASGEAATPSPLNHVTAIPKDTTGALAWVYRAERRLVAALRWSTVLLSLTLGILMAAQVVMRYGLQSPFLGMEELAPMIALWIYFLGMAGATRERDHITGGIVTLIFNDHRLICGIRMLGTVLSLFTVCVFGYYSQKHAWFNFSIGRTSPYMGFSKALWDFSMVAGFALSGFYLLLQLVGEARQFKNIATAKGDIQ